jgi:hypothetical protein
MTNNFIDELNGAQAPDRSAVARPRELAAPYSPSMVHTGGGGPLDKAVMTTTRDLCQAVGAALEIAGDRSGNRRQYQWRCCWRGSERAGEGSLRAYQIREPGERREPTGPAVPPARPSTGRTTTSEAMQTILRDAQTCAILLPEARVREGGQPQARPMPVTGAPLPQRKPNPAELEIADYE